jgi:predicted transcriptional regulator
MKRPLVIAFVAISMVPLCAHAQQPDMRELKADAQKVVAIISHDKAKSQIYCQVTDLGQQIDQEKDRKKAEALVEKMNELEKQLGPEYLELLKASKDVDPNSKDGEDIISLFDELDEACPEK